MRHRNLPSTTRRSGLSRDAKRDPLARKVGKHSKRRAGPPVTKRAIDMACEILERVGATTEAEWGRTFRTIGKDLRAAKAHEAGIKCTHQGNRP